MKKHNLLIIGNPGSHPSCKAFLIKFLKVLIPLTEKIYVISGDKIDITDGNVKWMKTPYRIRNHLLNKIISFLPNQLKLSAKVGKASKMVDTTIFFSCSMVLPLLIAKLNKKKIIVYAGGSASKNIKHAEKSIDISIFFIIPKIYEKLSFSFSDKIILESKSSLVFQNLIRYRDKVVMGGLYVDTDTFRCENEIKKRKNKIGYIGILDKNKGVDKFFKAITMIRDYLNERDIKVIIGGDGPLFDEIKNKLKKNGSCNKVELTGWIPHDELPTYLNELKLIVLPSHAEGLPNILLEAMACGTPVLATPIGAIPDVIKDGETGFILEDNSPECIAKNIKRALNHPDLDKIVKNARELVEKEYTYEAAVERYRMILKELS